MNKKEKIKRYIVMIIGLMLNACGVALLTRSGLGASPLAAIPYAMSLVLPRLSMGSWMTIHNLVLIAIQLAILGKKMEKRDLLLQTLLTFVYGFFTDFAGMLFAWVNPGNYVVRLLCLVIGCVFFGFGVQFELAGSLSMLPGTAFSKVISAKLGKEYGSVRVASDVSMTAISAVISLIFLKKLVSVREGTIIAAILVGNMVKIVGKLCSGFISRLHSWIKE